MEIEKEQDRKIREAEEAELDLLVDIWLAGSRQAHAFIAVSYWEENREAMRGLYLPLSENWVLVQQGEVQGFVSMMGEYLAALFVQPGQQHRGYGKALLEWVKRDREKIHLQVYARNEGALRFYERNGFQVTKESLDEPTGEKEYLMEWRPGE